MKHCLNSLLLLMVSLGAAAQNEFRLGIEVKDKHTNRPLMAIVSVLATGTESELTGQMLNDWYVVKVKPGIEYQVFVALQDYKTHRQVYIFEAKNLNSNGIQPLTIELESLKPPKTVEATGSNEGLPMVVVEKDSRAVLTRAVIRITHQPTGKVVEVKKNPSVSGGWLADIKEIASYKIEVSSPDHEPYQATSTLRPNEPLEITLKKIPKQELFFYVVDAQTGKPLAAQFKLTDEIKESYSGATTDVPGSFFAPKVFIQPQPYLLTVSANGYRKYQTKIKVDAPLPAAQATQTIRLSRGDVTVKIKIQEEQTSKILPANIRVIDQSTRQVALEAKNTSETLLTVNPEHQYTIEIEAKGFMSYQKNLDKALPTLEEANNLTIKLSKIGDTYASLSATDANGRPLEALFKITASLTAQTTELKSSPNSPAKYKISEPDIYHIEAIAPGYAPHKGDLDAEEIKAGQMFDYVAKLTVATTKPIEVAPKQFFFKVLDYQTKRSISNVQFKLFSYPDKQLIPSKVYDSGVQVSLAINQTYIAEVEANGYEKLTTKIDAAAMAKRGEFLGNFLLVPIKKTPSEAKTKPIVNEKIFDNIKAGQSVSIEDNIYFDQSSYLLRPESHGQLNRLATILRNNPSIKIEIIGHTDNVGDPKLNQILSEQRSKVISNYLINKGVEENRIEHRGAGQNQPLVSNDTEENRQRNRRVQFIIK
ncbi:MAG: OmpA family protein [Runella sp.]